MSVQPLTESIRKLTYSEKLRDPRWQRKRLEVMQRDDFSCVSCGDRTSTLHVHHRYYIGGADPWNYPIDALVTLCEVCHHQETNERPLREKELLDLLRKNSLCDELAAWIELVREILKAIDETNVYQRDAVVAIWERVADPVVIRMFHARFNEHPSKFINYLKKGMASEK